MGKWRMLSWLRQWYTAVVVSYFVMEQKSSHPGLLCGQERLPALPLRCSLTADRVVKLCAD